MKTMLCVGSVGVALVFGSASSAMAGHCDNGNNARRIRCLNAEVATLTADKAAIIARLDQLEKRLDGEAGGQLPAGAMVIWTGKDELAPLGWSFCKPPEGRSSFDGIWLVGTSEAKEAGNVVNKDPLTVDFVTGDGFNGNYYGWGDTETETPHATGRDHTHSGKIVIADRVAAGPPSMKVRFLCKAN